MFIFASTYFGDFAYAAYICSLRQTDKEFYFSNNFLVTDTNMAQINLDLFHKALFAQHARMFCSLLHEEFHKEEFLRGDLR